MNGEWGDAWPDAGSGRHWHEECGVFGAWGCDHAAQLTYYALYALQHRGQESAGIATVDGGEMFHHRGLGLVAEVFGPEDLERLAGKAAVGHVRYSTTGANKLVNAQPMVFDVHGGPLALGHNGNLVNAGVLRRELEDQGSIFQSTSDTEVVAHLIARHRGGSLVDAIVDSLRTVQGAYAFVFLTPDGLVAARDPQGLRPMALGRFGSGWVVASETCAFDTIGAEFVRDIEPGELLVINGGGVQPVRFAEAARKALCTFEYIYFARPDSDIDGRNVHLVRKAMGKRLAEEAPTEADVVIGVPDSSISAAVGYAEAAGIPYEMGLIKNKYIGRTFIQPSQALRERGVRLKLNPVRKVVEGKRVVMVDDSIVRGTTSRRIVQMLRDAGAREVHVRISSPPVRFPCYYGIDTSAREELLAARLSVEEMTRAIGADSLAFLSEDGMLQALGAGPEAEGRGQGGPGDTFCNACFHGWYPTRLYDDLGKHVMEMAAHRGGYS
ncbi:amidophosphoribosyltransferase [Kyrpidia spormannii]|uniref:Amidophosphoribosyltransferase n=1 Tax=Kyrpidia spormannii TaxID=2055160 RepID=A0A2K8NAK7_9BACL|nr:amidophosphoribosyltransferase [Kyrpidia spormannii]ATY86354.1 amidophosphoribosyltransferase [Kyrpidia spormannii]